MFREVLIPSRSCSRGNFVKCFLTTGGGGEGWIVVAQSFEVVHELLLITLGFYLHARESSDDGGYVRNRDVFGALGNNVS